LSLIESVTQQSGADGYGKAKLLDLSGNAFQVGNHADGRAELVIIGTMANVLYHARETSAGSGEFGREKEIEDRYGAQVLLENNADGTLVLYFRNMDREIVYMAATENGWSRRVKTDMYGNWMEAAVDGDGRVNLFIIGTLGNVLTHTRQVAANSNEWTKETDLEGYGKGVEPAINMNGKLDLIYIAMLANEVHVTRQK